MSREDRGRRSRRSPEPSDIVVLSTPIISFPSLNRRNRSNDNGRPNRIVGVPALITETFFVLISEHHRARTHKPEVNKHQGGRGRLRALGGAGVLGTVSTSTRAFASIETWRQGPLEGNYVFVGGLSTSSAAGEGPYENVAVLVAIGVNSAGDQGRSSGCSEGGTPSPRSPGANSSPGSGHGLSGVGSSPATSARGCSALEEECSPGPLPALHGAFLPQRAGKGSVTRRKAAAMLKCDHAQ